MNDPILEMSESCVFTRKISNIVKELFDTSLSKSFVSKLTVELDPMGDDWRNGPLAKAKFPYKLINVLHIKVREENRVVSKSYYIASVINKKGNREIMGLMIQNGEYEATWTNFFENLKQSGL